MNDDVAIEPDLDGGQAEQVSTGVPAVDAVIESVAALEDSPVEEHAAAFESAHDQLRRALDARPDDA